MNQIYIGPKYQQYESNTKVFNIQFGNVDSHLPLLRSDYFSAINIRLPQNVDEKNLKFMMNLTRVSKKNGTIQLLNAKQSNQTRKFSNIAKKLGLYQNANQESRIIFSKNKPEDKSETTTQNSKLSIGFKSYDDQQIDEDDLLKNQNIDIKKEKTENCGEKPRACANCNCGRKDTQQPLISKQDLVTSVNEGKPVSGCGKCYLGDSFRCGSCPYKGMPAFKPGDKLKLVQQGQVQVETGDYKVQGGKVKIQL